MDNPQKQQILEQLKSANNVLVAVSNNPTVDELAASVGLTLALNKLGKHATTVFSGVVPSTIEFLEPERTIETTTDSLRDFIIALDKSKADKLRYKVEDNVVRIFITPYRTSLTEHDLEFSQGDFNVDAVVAIGVTKKEDLDKAITSHGRILHDATVISLTKRENVSQIGSIVWQDQQASSLCEMVASVAVGFGPDVVDGQMATAFMTGIIAETDRFKNDLTTPNALALSSQLMSAGANQQLIAEKLEEPHATPEPLQGHEMGAHPPEKKEDGTLDIDHSDGEVNDIQIDEHGNLDMSKDGQNNNAQPLEPIADQSATDDIQDVPADQDVKSHLSIPSADPDKDHGVTSESLLNSNAPMSEDNADKADESPLMPASDNNQIGLKHERVISPVVEDEIQADNSDNQKDQDFDLNQALDSQAQAASMSDNSTVLPPPQSDNQTTAQSTPKATNDDSVNDADIQAPLPLGVNDDAQQLDHVDQSTPAQDESTSAPASEPSTVPLPTEGTLEELEKSVDSPHVSNSSDLEEAQKAVSSAVESQPSQFPKAEERTGANIVELNSTIETPSIPAPPVQMPPQTEESQPKEGGLPIAPPVPPPMTTSPQFFDEQGKSIDPLTK